MRDLENRINVLVGEKTMLETMNKQLRVVIVFTLFYFFHCPCDFPNDLQIHNNVSSLTSANDLLRAALEEDRLKIAELKTELRSASFHRFVSCLFCQICALACCVSHTPFRYVKSNLSVLATQFASVNGRIARSNLFIEVRDRCSKKIIQ